MLNLGGKKQGSKTSPLSILHLNLVFQRFAIGECHVLFNTFFYILVDADKVNSK